jgi:hypothetical protein
MPMTAHFAICNWERFQHYKDRDPPWVKLYRDLLTSESWVLGTDLSRVVQIASTLLAPRYGNQIPMRFDLLRRVMSLDCKESEFNQAIRHLVNTGFLEIHGVTSEPKSPEQSASTMLATCTSETETETETEQRRDRAEKNHVAQERDGPVERVFAHWQSEFGHQRSALDLKRRKVIEAALKSYDEATLRASITGYKSSPHHMGQNERRTVYDDISLFLRDAAHIDAGLQFARGPPRQVSAVERIQSRMRNGAGDGRVVSEQGGTGLEPVSGLLR